MGGKAITSLKNYFLIAMPALMEPEFYHTVVYLCEHNDQGSIGIIINQPVSMLLGEVLRQLGIPNEDPKLAKRLVFSGGPVHRERGFILHPTGGKWENTIAISSNISLTTSADILQAIAKNEGPSEFLIALGYFHWEAGQLEKELSDNAWLYGPSNPEVMFHLPVEQRWRAAAAFTGIDTDKISDEIGHA